ncbi:hypothetical protein WJX73_001661 [Symbiochloris irregularis]|uniref:Uncharacterized protein n=1 Tax=Symbiochloris irregularis TaxID=706552 RepID=A0AAW1NPU2_9CHLO
MTPHRRRQSSVSFADSSWADHSMQGAIRAGCLNLILSAIQTGHAGQQTDAAAAARQLLASSLISGASNLLYCSCLASIAIVDRGEVTHHFTVQELDKRLPLPLQSLKGNSGLLWLEVERDAILSICVPVVVSADQDVVEEVCELDDDILQNKISVAEAEQLLLKIGSVLEFAQHFTERMPPAATASQLTSPTSSLDFPSSKRGSSESDDPQRQQQQQPTSADPSKGAWDARLSNVGYAKAMAQGARDLVALCCMRDWPALLSKILPTAALGCGSFTELVEAVEAVCPIEGGLLASAVCQGSLSLTNMLLKMQDSTGYVWDLTRPIAGETVLHWAARLSDEGCMAGLLLTRCPQASLLWSSLTNARGETPLSIEQRLASQGRHWNYLTPSERAAVEIRAERRLLETHGTDRTISVALSDNSSMNQGFPANYSHWEAGAEAAHALLATHTGALLTTGLSTENSGMLQRAIAGSGRSFTSQHSTEISRPQLSGMVTAGRRPSHPKPPVYKSTAALLSRSRSSQNPDHQSMASRLPSAPASLPGPRTMTAQGVDSPASSPPASSAMPAGSAAGVSSSTRNSMEVMWTPFMAMAARRMPSIGAPSHLGQGPPAHGLTDMQAHREHSVMLASLSAEAGTAQEESASMPVSSHPPGFDTAHDVPMSTHPGPDQPDDLSTAMDPSSGRPQAYGRIVLRHDPSESASALPHIAANPDRLLTQHPEALRTSSSALASAQRMLDRAPSSTPSSVRRCSILQNPRNANGIQPNKRTHKMQPHIDLPYMQHSSSCP